MKQANPEIFLCGSCSNEPLEPVVSECGHIFWYKFSECSWSCISSSGLQQSECPVCESKITPKKCYTIFIQHEQSYSQEQSEMIKSEHIKPPPIYNPKIINPGIGNSTMSIGLSNIPNNIVLGKQVPGPNCKPSLAICVFNKIAEPKEGELDQKVYQQCSKVSFVLGILIIAMIVLVFVL